MLMTYGQENGGRRSEISFSFWGKFVLLCFERPRRGCANDENLCLQYLFFVSYSTCFLFPTVLSSLPG